MKEGGFPLNILGLFGFSLTCLQALLPISQHRHLVNLS